MGASHELIKSYNVGSYKIIESNGGILENKIENEDAGEKFLTRRYWIEK